MPSSIVSSVKISAIRMTSVAVRDGIMKAIREIPLASDPSVPSPDTTHLRFWPVLTSEQEEFVVSVLRSIEQDYADQLTVHYYEFTVLTTGDIEQTDLRIIIAGEKTIQVIRDTLNPQSLAPK